MSTIRRIAIIFGCLLLVIISFGGIMIGYSDERYGFYCISGNDEIFASPYVPQWRSDTTIPFLLHYYRWNSWQEPPIRLTCKGYLSETREDGTYSYHEIDHIELDSATYYSTKEQREYDLLDGADSIDSEGGVAARPNVCVAEGDICTISGRGWLKNGVTSEFEVVFEVYRKAPEWSVSLFLIEFMREYR